MTETFKINLRKIKSISCQSLRYLDIILFQIFSLQTPGNFRKAGLKIQMTGLVDSKYLTNRIKTAHVFTKIPQHSLFGENLQ